MGFKVGDTGYDCYSNEYSIKPYEFNWLIVFTDYFIATSKEPIDGKFKKFIIDESGYNLFQEKKIWRNTFRD